MEASFMEHNKNLQVYREDTLWSLQQRQLCRKHKSKHSHLASVEFRKSWEEEKGNFFVKDNSGNIIFLKGNIDNIDNICNIDSTGNIGTVCRILMAEVFG